MYRVAHSTMNSTVFSIVQVKLPGGCVEEFLRKQYNSARHFVLMYSTVYSAAQCTVLCTFQCSVQYMHVGCPGTHWVITSHLVKIKAKIHCKNSSSVRLKFAAPIPQIRANRLCGQTFGITPKNSPIQEIKAFLKMEQQMDSESNQVSVIHKT